MFLALPQHNNEPMTVRRKLWLWLRRQLSDQAYTRLIYLISSLRRRQFPEWLNLRNPKTWNDKISYLKIHIEQLIPNADVYADKLRVRDYVVETVGERHVVPLLGSWRSAEEVPWSELPDRFVIKVNHGYGANLIVRDRSELDIRAATAQLEVWLQTDFWRNGRERQYQHIPRRVLAEKLLESDDGADLVDYKLHCFDGTVGMVQVQIDRWSDHRAIYVDCGWRRLPFHKNHPSSEAEIPQPQTWDRMREVAQSLAAPFFYVRVDLYEAAGEVYVGELTFTPGQGKSPFYPRAWNRKLGDLIHLPSIGVADEQL